MTSKLACVLIVSTSLMGSATLAQTNDAGGQDSASVNQPVHKATAPPADQSMGVFVTKQAVTEWRAPKLVGVTVYGADDQRVGKIKDVVIDHDGSVRAVVIGVGGFLGIGTKDIGVPFTTIQWRTEGRVVPTTGAPPANPLGRTDVEAKPTFAKTDPAATEANQGYPDKAVLSVTLAQLKAAPDYEYAPDPLTELSSGERQRSAN